MTDAEPDPGGSGGSGGSETEDEIDDEMIIGALTAAGGAVGAFFEDLVDLGAGAGDVLSEFASDPVGFIITIVASWIVGGILTMAGHVGHAVLTVFGIIGDVLVLIGSPFVDNLAVPIGDTITDTISLTNSIITDVALATGPAAPIAVVLLWGALSLALAYGLWIASRATLEFIRTRPIV